MEKTPPVMLLALQMIETSCCCRHSQMAPEKKKVIITVHLLTWLEVEKVQKQIIVEYDPNQMTLLHLGLIEDSSNLMAWIRKRLLDEALEYHPFFEHVTHRLRVSQLVFCDAAMFALL